MDSQVRGEIDGDMVQADEARHMRMKHYCTVAAGHLHTVAAASLHNAGEEHPHSVAVVNMLPAALREVDSDQCANRDLRNRVTAPRNSALVGAHSEAQIELPNPSYRGCVVSLTVRPENASMVAAPAPVEYSQTRVTVQLHPSSERPGDRTGYWADCCSLAKGVLRFDVEATASSL